MARHMASETDGHNSEGISRMGNARDTLQQTRRPVNTERRARWSTVTNARVPAARHVDKIAYTKTTEEYAEARKQYNIRSTLDAFIRIRDELGVDILKKVRRLIKERTRATELWVGLLQRVAPGHDMIARIAQVKIRRKSKTLRNIPIVAQRERDKMDTDYCLKCVEQARKRVKVDPMYQTYRRLSDLINDQHIRFSDPMESGLISTDICGIKHSTRRTRAEK
jgi:hypothetical protein